MRVYVETNFLLELVLSQEQHQSCDEIIALCQSASISLTLPAFSIPEAYSSLVGKQKRRERFARDFEDHRAELIRSSRFKDRTDLLDGIGALLIESIQQENQEFYASLNRVLVAAEIIPLNSETLRSAVTLATSMGLQLPDAIVLASVLGHLIISAPNEACFLNRDRDFSDPFIVQELTQRGCKMLFSFAEGANYLRAWQERS